MGACSPCFFVLCFNFFLFRIMPGDPAGLLARSQRLTETEIAEQRALFGLDQPLLQQFVHVPEGDADRQPRDVVPHRPAGRRHHLRAACGRPSCWSASARRSAIVLGLADGDQGRVAAWLHLRPDEPVRLPHALLHPRGLARHDAAHHLRRHAGLVPRRRLRQRRRVHRPGARRRRPQPPRPARGHAGPRLRGVLHDRDAVVPARGQGRGLHRDRTRQGPDRDDDPSAARRAQRLPALASR